MLRPRGQYAGLVLGVEFLNAAPRYSSLGLKVSDVAPKHTELCELKLL